MTWLANRSLGTERIGFLAILIVCVLGLNVFLFLESDAHLDRTRQTAEESAGQWTKNLALALEREIAGQIGQIDIALLSVIDEIQRQEQEGGIDPPKLQAFLLRTQQRLPRTDAIRITDADGMLRYGTDFSPERSINLSDREHFRILKARPDAGLVVSHPQISRANGKWVVALARSITGNDGRFMGMAFIPVPIASLTDTFSRISIPEQGSITLRSSKLELIARYPPKGSEHLGQSKVSQAFVDLLEKGATEGSYFATTPLDGIARLLYFRKVGDYPLLLIVGRAKTEYLATWTKEHSQAMLTNTSFLLISILLSALIYLSWRRAITVRDRMALMAKTDYLTGLANRRAFLTGTETEIARAQRYGAPVSLLMFDIDHFKIVNDSHGHAVGDLALQHLAACARTSLREVDLVGRWGGEEFVVLLPETDELRAAEAAERLRSTIEATPFRNEQVSIKLTVSIGCATFSNTISTIDALLKQADEALYNAKNGGRNQIFPALASIQPARSDHPSFGERTRIQ